MKHIILYAGFALALALPTACSQDDGTDGAAPAPTDARHTPMTFAVTHPAQTRATDAGFDEGDSIGLFVAAEDAPLEIGGNLVNNEPLRLTAGTWAANRTLYWDEGTYNAYAYYPYTRPVSSVDDLPFSVSLNQGATAEGAQIDGYEASDLLYARAEGVSASASPIPLTFRHIMSKLTIRLVKGEDFEGDMPTEADVYVHNTVPTATIDLSAGVATRDVYGTRATITARQQGDNIYSAIIVPQRVENRMPLIEVIMKGVSYIYESTFQFKPGVEHLVNLVISDNPDQVKIEIGGEIVGWQ